MKKLLILLTVLFMGIVCFAQTNAVYTKSPTIDERLKNIEQRLEVLDADLSLKNRFKMYRTENIYNLLKLDTQTGQVWQVQWSLYSAEEGTWEVNGDDLSKTNSYGPNTFELYPTKNMYQFILIDKTDGRTWHIQWSTDSSAERWIRRIY